MGKNHICPWQGGQLLASSIRKLGHNPRRIVDPYLKPGMTAMDIGCGMGFLTIPMAEIAGAQGKIIAVDLQPEMLAGLEKKARKAGVGNIIYHPCAKNTLNIRQWDNEIDYAVIFMMLHEVPDAGRLINEIYAALAPDGKLMFSEPVGHVSKYKFLQSDSLIRKAGFKTVESPKISFCRSFVYQKTA